MHIGIDLGGTKTEIIALNTRSEELYRKRIETIKGSYSATLSSIKLLIEEAEKTLGGSCTVGLGIPGTISPATGLVKNANSTWLIGQPLAIDLENTLSRSVNIANDADCFTLSEASDGAGKGFRSVFGVILGTGVGGGLYLNRQLHFGPNAIAGEWGHNPLPWPSDEERPGAICYCGKHGCIETWLSGPALEREVEIKSGLKRSAKDLAAHMDQYADECLEAYSDRLARSLATVINIVDPEVIVLGGGISNIESIYPQVNNLLPQYVFSDSLNCKVVKNIHGDSSGVRGAAWLGAQKSTGKDT